MRRCAIPDRFLRGAKSVSFPPTSTIRKIETAMAHAPSNGNPVTEEAFTADRQRMFAGFCSATTISVVVSVVTLALMAIFLV